MSVDKTADLSVEKMAVMLVELSVAMLVVGGDASMDERSVDRKVLK